MPFAVVQTELDPTPTREQLRAAFAAVKELTRHDAALAARDAFGVLVEKLPFDSAAAVQQALAAQGVATEVVDQAELVRPPPAKRLRRLDCLAEHLVVYDALGRPRPTPWAQVRVIAAGTVPRVETRRVETERMVRTPVQHIPVVVVDFQDKEETNLRTVLELLVEAAPPRYRAFADEFHYAYLDSRLAGTAAENFVLMVRDLLRLAPDAMVGRGALALTHEPPQTFSYPGEHAFEEEIVWLLWKLRRRRAAADGE